MSDQKSKTLEGIKSVESSGNYQAQNPKSTASGAYQFTNSTWKDTVNKETFEKYPRAKDAPNDVQDQAASVHYDKLKKQMKTEHDTIRAWEQGATGAKSDPSKGEIYSKKVETRIKDIEAKGKQK